LATQLTPMNFFRVFAASFLGVITAFLFLFVIFLLLLGALSAFFSLSYDDTIGGIENNSVLELNLNKVVKDRTSPIEQELEDILGLDYGQIGLNEVTDIIQRSQNDNRIEGIILQGGYPIAGWTQIATIRDALVKFKSSGKFIYAYDDFYTQKGYYLSSVADTVVVHPMGMLSFKGLVSEVLYYKDIQDKYGIRMDIIRSGDFKSAGEPYITNRMSPENRLQISQMLFSIWNDFRQDIALSRDLTESRVDDIADDLEAALVEDALRVGLIDTLLNKEQFNDLVKQKLGVSEDKSFEKVSIYEADGLKSVRSKGAADRIGVVYAQGPIVYGKGFEGVIGNVSLCKTLKSVGQKSSIKAVVLRINSPGGSAIASEMIWQCIENLKEKKPVVVSMGDVAASGGYYIAAGADQIVADPKTITGSIGVVFGMLNAKDFFKDIGIDAQQVTTHKNALDYSLFEGIQPGFRNVQLKEIDKIYTIFKDRVAQGRELSSDEVERLARGRIWSGQQAFENGLIDGFGDLEVAINKAAELADVTDYSVSEYPRFKSSWESYLNAFGGVYKNKVSKSVKFDNEISDRMFNEIDNLKLVQDGPQTILPYHIRIR